jgi:hypothetical protein
MTIGRAVISLTNVPNDSSPLEEAVAFLEHGREMVEFIKRIDAALFLGAFDTCSEDYDKGYEIELAHEFKTLLAKLPSKEG